MELFRKSLIGYSNLDFDSTKIYWFNNEYNFVSIDINLFIDDKTEDKHLIKKYDEVCRFCNNYNLSKSGLKLICFLSIKNVI